MLDQEVACLTRCLSEELRQDIERYIRGADILVHEVFTIEGQDTACWANSGKEDRHNFGNIIGCYHANTKNLAEIANEANPKLLVLYHVQNHTSPLRPEAPVEEIKTYAYD